MSNAEGWGPGQWGNPAPVNLGARRLVRPPTPPQTETVTPVLEGFTKALNGQVVALAINEDSQGYIATDGDTKFRFARLNWRVGEREQTADIDIKAGGTTFPLACDFFKLSVVIQDPTARERVYMASATVGGQQVNVNAPTRSIITTVAPGPTVAVPIPTHATVVYVSSTSDNGPLLINLLDSKGTFTATIQQFGATNNPSNRLPVPQGTRQVSFVNLGPFTVNVAVIFELGF